MPGRTLEQRVREIEDRLEIYNLIASHPPSADTGVRDHVQNAWTDDGTFDRGAQFGGAMRQRESAGGIDNPEHMRAIAQGLAHFSGLPYVRIERDTAFAISYLQILVPDRVGPEFEVPNHGSGRGFHIHRVSANRWDFVRTAEGWKIASRRLRPLDGDEEAREILRGTFAETAG
jgi:hypothetical protein